MSLPKLAIAAKPVAHHQLFLLPAGKTLPAGLPQRDFWLKLLKRKDKFDYVLIETTGGHHPIVCHGHTKGDAVKMKALLERFQTDYYRRETAGVR